MFSKISTAAIAAGLMAAAGSTPASAQEVSSSYDGEWLSVSGTVDSVSGDAFMLDYGDKTIPVEMDDYDWYSENPLVVGDQVTVTGRMDDDFFQSRRIEASSLYVDSLHTQFYASADDEEDVTVPLVDFDTLRTGGLSLTGTVQSVDDEEFVLDTGAYDYRVDTQSLYYDPFDATGIQHVAVGDRVSVTGSIDDADFFDNREIDATSLTELIS
jgi:uncharacterized protein YdeI (BOF family)